MPAFVEIAPKFTTFFRGWPEMKELIRFDWCVCVQLTKTEKDTRKQRKIKSSPTLFLIFSGVVS
jgi:hypothetical protein